MPGGIMSIHTRRNGSRTWVGTMKETRRRPIGRSSGRWSTASADRGSMKVMKEIGVDYCYAYTWITPDVNVQRQNNIAQRDAAAAEQFGMLPSISMGWDREAWGVHDGGWVPMGDYRTLLQRTRDDLMPSLPVDSLGRRIVMLPNWNEFGEGHFLLPNASGGFGYLDAMREVFAASGAHEYVKPTDQQKRRFTVLYPKD